MKNASSMKNIRLNNCADRMKFIVSSWWLKPPASAGKALACLCAHDAIAL